MPVTGAEEPHAWPAQIGTLTASPYPSRKADTGNRSFGASRRKIDEQFAYLTFDNSLQMLAKRINGPAALIVRGINRGPSRLDEFDQAAFEPQPLLIKLPQPLPARKLGRQPLAGIANLLS